MDDGGKTRKELLLEVERLQSQLAAAERDHQIVVAGLRDEYRLAETEWRRQVEVLEAKLARDSSETHPSVDRPLKEIGLEEEAPERQSLQAMIQNQAEELQAANEELALQAEELQSANEELTIQAEELRISNEELSAQAGILEQHKNELEHLTRVLEIERTLLKSVLEQMPASVVIVAAPDGPLWLSNHLANQTWDEPLQDLCDMEAFWRIRRYHPDGRVYRKEEMPLWRSLHLGEVVLDEEFTLRPKGRPSIHLIVNSAPVRDQEGRIVAGVVTHFDITARKRVHEALLRSKQQTVDILESISDGFFSCDKEMVVTYFNSAAGKLLGRHRDEVVGKRLFDAFPEARGSVFEEKYSEALREGKFISFEAYFEPEPYQNWYDVRVFPFDGGISVYFQVTTERKQAEKALWESREDLNRAQAVAHTGSWRLDVQRNELAWSDETYRMFGIDQGTPLTYEAFLAIVHPEDREHVDRRWTAALAGEPYDLEHRILVGDAVKWVRERAELDFDSQGRLFGGFGTVQDISERKQAEAALRENEARLRMAQQVARIGTFEWNIQSGVNMWTPELEAMYGLAPGDFARTQTAWENLVHPEDRSEAIHRAEIAFETDEPMEGEWRVVWPDGSIHWLAGRWQVLKDESGKPLRMTGINIDITERKQAEAALKRAHDELEQRVRERTAELRDTVAQLIEEVQERQRAEDSLRKQAKLLELAQEAIIVRDLDSRVVFWNRGAEETYGWPREQAMGQVTHNLLKSQFPTSQEEVVQELLQTGQWQGELVHTRADGEEIMVASRMALQRNDQGQPVAILEVNRNITARRRAEEAQKTERQRLLLVLERIPAHVALLRPDYTFAYVNGEFIRRFGEPGAKRCYEVVGQQNPCEECPAMAVFHTRKPVVREWAGPDGKYYQMHDYPFIDMDGSPLVLEMGVDITARKQAGEQVASLGRMYRMLSKVNEAIVRVSSKDDLFRQICRIMMEEGNFLLAWIGLVDPDTRLVKAAAHYDLADEYIQNLVIPVDDVPAGRGPTGTAVREGRYDVCNDIAGDPRMAPWREPALARGFQASAAFPLRVGPGVVGALTIYADRPGFFTADEITLLESLADDLSFALEFMARDAKRRLVEEVLRESEERLRHLASQLLHAQEKERRYLALELHDDLGQSLMVLKMQLRVIEKTVSPDHWRTKEECAHCLNYLNAVIDNVRRLARNLRPSVLDDLGLAAGLRVLTDEFRKYHEVELSLEMDDLDGLFTRDEEINIYRIFQEILTNIAKHAQARQVRIVIRRRADEVSFQVTDDGVGFDLEQVLVRDAAKKGLGLAALEERVRILGGALTIKSQEHLGTEVAFTVPSIGKRQAH